MPTIALTPKQEKFILEYIKCNNKTQAYKSAYNTKNMNENTIMVKACIEFKKDKVRVRYQQLLDEMGNEFVMSALEKRRMLKSIIENDEEKIDNKLKAIDLDNKMAGEYVTKIETTDDFNVNLTIGNEKKS